MKIMGLFFCFFLCLLKFSAIQSTELKRKSYSTYLSKVKIARNKTLPFSNRTIAPLTKFPFRLTECNQVIHVDGETINDRQDYSGRSKVYFVINAYSVNYFKKKNPNKFFRSIHLTNSTISIDHLRGGKGCLKVFHKRSKPNNVFSTTKKVVPVSFICVRSLEEAKNLLEVFRFYQQCREGSITDMEQEHLNDLLMQELKKLEQECNSKTVEEIMKRLRRIKAIYIKKDNNTTKI